MKMEKSRYMVLLMIYVLLSSLGLMFLKLGTAKGIGASFKYGFIDIKMNVYLLIGFALYVCAFVFSLIAMSIMKLSYFYPVSAGMTYILICLLSYFVLSENIGKTQLLGMAVILFGVILMNLNRG